MGSVFEYKSSGECISVMTILYGTLLLLLLSMRYKMQLYHLSLLLKSLGKSIHMKQKLHTTKCYNKLHVYIVCLSYSTCNVVIDHHRKSVLDKHLSAVSHIK